MGEHALGDRKGFLWHMMVFWRALISSGVPILWFVSGVNLELYGVIICVECVPTLAGKNCWI